MLILGGRYGSVEPDSGKSYTQLEYAECMAILISLQSSTSLMIFDITNVRKVLYLSG